MGASRNLGDFFQEFDVLRMPSKFVIADQSTEGFAAEDTEFFFVDFLE